VGDSVANGDVASKKIQVRGGVGEVFHTFRVRSQVCIWLTSTGLRFHTSSRLVSVYIDTSIGT
jgi:hypothetical protein